MPGLFSRKGGRSSVRTESRPAFTYLPTNIRNPLEDFLANYTTFIGGQDPSQLVAPLTPDEQGFFNWLSANPQIWQGAFDPFGAGMSMVNAIDPTSLMQYAQNIGQYGANIGQYGANIAQTAGAIAPRAAALADFSSPIAAGIRNLATLLFARPVRGGGTAMTPMMAPTPPPTMERPVTRDVAPGLTLTGMPTTLAPGGAPPTRFAPVTFDVEPALTRDFLGRLGDEDVMDLVSQVFNQPVVGQDFLSQPFSRLLAAAGEAPTLGIPELAATISGQFLGPTPELQEFIGAAQRPVISSFEDVILPAIQSAAVKAGGLGSTAAARSVGLAGKNLMQQLGDISAQIAYPAYQAERDRMVQALSLPPQYFSAETQRLLGALGAAPRFAEAGVSAAEAATARQLGALGLLPDFALADVAGADVVTRRILADIAGEEAVTGRMSQALGAMTGALGAEAAARAAGTGALTDLFRAQTGLFGAQTGLFGEQADLFGDIGRLRGQALSTMPALQSAALAALFGGQQLMAIPRSLAQAQIDAPFNRLAQLLGVYLGAPMGTVSRQYGPSFLQQLLLTGLQSAPDWIEAIGSLGDRGRGG